MKLILALVTIFLLSACNVEKGLMQNIGTDVHQDMSYERFERLSDVITTNEQWVFAYSKRITPHAKGEVVYVAPGIAFAMGTSGKLIARKAISGEIAYSLLVQLEYYQGPMRYYSSATDMSGNKFELNRISAFEKGCAGQTCYKDELIELKFSQDIMNEASLDDLFLTFKARAHEKREAKKNKNQEMGIMEMLDFAAEARGETIKETKKNYNIDVVIPKGYVRNFIKLVKNQ